jgi:DNA polymerase-3 subunit gamma/tau
LLNEAEMNFKQARNKRLHVELTLIKLCYLNEALDMVNEGSSTSKKKQLESVRPVAFRAIPIVARRSKDQSKPPVQRVSINEEPGESRLTIITEDEVPKTKKQTAEIPVIKKEEAAPKVSTKLGKLDAIRQQVAYKTKCADTTVKELNADQLRCAWDEYILRLVDRKNPSAVSNFKNAVLTIIDNNTIEIIVESMIQQRFVENERAGLIEHLQKYFNNRTLKYQFKVVEDTNSTPVERPLNSKEQYMKMIEEYPLIKELKERLNLNLDF